MTSNNVIALVIGMIFFVGGVQLFRGRWLFLVAGYNTMSKEKRKKLNGRFIGKVIGTMLLLSCLIIFAMLIYPEVKTFYFIL